MYHRFATDVAVAAFDVREGDVTHAATGSCCYDVTRVMSVVRQGDAVRVEVGCCAVRMAMTLREEHVLSYSGTLAVIG